MSKGFIVEAYAGDDLDELEAGDVHVQDLQVRATDDSSIIQLWFEKGGPYVHFEREDAIKFHEAFAEILKRYVEPANAATISEEASGNGEAN